MKFKLSQPDSIKTPQLIDEINKATGLDVAERLDYYPPDTVAIRGEDVEGKAAQVQKIVAAHVPVAAYTQEEKEASALASRVMDLAKGAEGKLFNDLLAAERNALIVAMLYRAGALDRAGRVRPLREWVQRP